MEPSHLRRLTLRQIQIFLAICRHESHSRAAEELALTQPAVSAQVRNLEELVGEPLFDYLGKQLYLTPAGQALRRAGQELLQRLGHLEMELAELRGVISGALSLAVESSAQYFLPAELAAFCRQHPAVTADMQVMNHDQVLKGLLENRHELVVMGRVPEDRSLRFIPFRDNHLLAVCAPDNPLRHGPPLSLVALAEQPLLVREPGSGTRGILEEHCQAQGIRLGERHQFGSLEALKGAVAAGLGVAVLPEDACRRALAAGHLAAVPVEGFPLRRSWCLVHRRARHLSAVAEALIKHLLATP